VGQRVLDGYSCILSWIDKKKGSGEKRRRLCCTPWGKILKRRIAEKRCLGVSEEIYLQKEFPEVFLFYVSGEVTGKRECFGRRKIMGPLSFKNASEKGSSLTRRGLDGLSRKDRLTTEKRYLENNQRVGRPIRSERNLGRLLGAKGIDQKTRVVAVP